MASRESAPAIRPATAPASTTWPLIRAPHPRSRPTACVRPRLVVQPQPPILGVKQHRVPRRNILLARHLHWLRPRALRIPRRPNGHIRRALMRPAKPRRQQFAARQLHNRRRMTLRKRRRPRLKDELTADAHLHPCCAPPAHSTHSRPSTHHTSARQSSSLRNLIRAEVRQRHNSPGGNHDLAWRRLSPYSRHRNSCAPSASTARRSNPHESLRFRRAVQHDQAASLPIREANRHQILVCRLRVHTPHAFQHMPAESPQHSQLKTQ